MRSCIKFLTLFLLLIPFRGLSAQELPQLGRAGEIKSGTLPNGVEYYMVPTQISKGRADFALVQKGARHDGYVRRSLASLPHFECPSPVEFLLGLGVAPGPEGYVRELPGALVYDFRDIPVHNAAIRDSTLLLICDLMELYPAGQALVVSGDIDAGQLSERLYMLSLSVPARSVNVPSHEYEWSPFGSRRVYTGYNVSGSLGRISLSYSAPRTPVASMNTSLPLVSRMYTLMLGEVLGRRLGKAFEAEGLPLAGYSFDYDDDPSGDTCYGFTIDTRASDIQAAMSIIGAVSGELDSAGASQEEFRAAREALAWSAALRIGNVRLSNAEYVGKCIDSYLYGASLASEDARNRFLSQISLDPAVETGLFNRYIAALLDPQLNLTVRFEVPGGVFDQDKALSAFDYSWGVASQSAGFETVADPVPVTDFSAGKVRRVNRKGVIKDAVTGGEIWTFANGMKVVYKKTASKGRIRYAWLLNGGSGGIQGLAEGEAAFAGDMLDLCEVASVPLSEARRMLACKGVSFESELTLSDLRFSGEAPRDQLPLVLDFLAAYANSRRVDAKASESYFASEPLRIQRSLLGDAGIRWNIDRMTCPGFAYSEAKDPEKLSPAIQGKVESYLKRQFSKSADGALIIIGDIEPVYLEDVLRSRLGAFTCGKQFAVRPQFNYRLPSAWRTFTDITVGGAAPLTLAMTIPNDYSQEGNYAFAMAARLLGRRIDAALLAKGLYAEYEVTNSMFPSETARLLVRCRYADVSGLPEGIVGAPVEEVLRSVRAAIASAASEPVSDAEFNAVKADLRNDISSAMADEAVMMQNALIRNSFGRDMAGSYDDRAKSVGKARVQEIIGKLSGFNRVEYMTR